MSTFIQNLLCNGLMLTLKAIEFVTTKCCLVCCQCMRRFPGVFWIIVRILIATFFMTLSIFLAVCSYIFLYWLLIPSLHYERPIYFDYSLSSPISIINIDQQYEYYLFDLPFESVKQYQSTLKPNEVYDLTINIHIPSKQEMHDIGNVMIKLSLYTCDDKTNKLNIKKEQQEFEYLSNDKFQKKYGWHLLRKSIRPILLKYESTLIRIVKKIICIIPYCLGLWNEDKYISIPIMYGFHEIFDNPTCAAVIQLSTNKFHIYDATLYADIQLQGLKYFLYHWWLTFSFFTIIIFTFVCCCTTSPALMLCCYQVNKVRDCYNQEMDDDEHDTQTIQEIQQIADDGKTDTQPIQLLDDIMDTKENTNVVSASTSVSSSSSPSRSTGSSSTTSSLLLTASPSESKDNDNLLAKQSGLRLRKQKNITDDL